MTDRPTSPPDPARRDFFRRFAGEVVTSVGAVIGAAQTLQEQSAEAARDLLGPDAVAPASGGRRPEIDASTAGFRAPFRLEGDTCLIVDQRRLPDVIAELEIRGAAEAVTAINEGAVVGSPAQAQVAAIALALAAARTRNARPYARRASIRGAGNALASTRKGSAVVRAAVDRMLARFDAFPVDAGGDEVAAALRAEAESLVSDATAAHGALVTHGLAALPGAADEPLRVLTLDSTGAMGGGQFGTALSVIVAAHHAGRPVHALVAETRPGFEGSRIAAWELGQAGVAHAVVTDAAAPGCIAAGEVDAVLVGADRVAANGDVVAHAGVYPVALAAAARGVPVLVCVPAAGIDPATPDGAAATIEQGRPGAVLRAAGTRVAPEGTPVRSPAQEVVPAGLVGAIVTELGALRPPLAEGLARLVAARTTGAAGTTVATATDGPAGAGHAPADAVPVSPDAARGAG